MKKLLIGLIYFIIATFLVIFFGFTDMNPCSPSGVCLSGSDLLFNPAVRPLTFAIFHIPNVLRGEVLSDGCGVGANMLFFLDIPFIVMLLMFLKKLFVFIVKKITLKNKDIDSKTKLFNLTIMKEKIFFIFYCLLVILIMINTFFYFTVPHK